MRGGAMLGAMDEILPEFRHYSISRALFVRLNKLGAMDEILPVFRHYSISRVLFFR